MMLTAIGACASSQHRKTTDGERQMIVHVTNNLTPPSDVTVYAVGQDGIRRLIGDVPPNKDKALKIPGDLPPGMPFRIVADRGLGRPVVSQPINASTDGLIIDWDLQNNSIWFPDVSN
jgi:hypothetical protein